MAAGRVWAGADVGKDHHWVCVVDDTGAVVLSRKLVNEERPNRELVTEIDRLGDQVSWTADLTTVYAALLLTMLADAGRPVRYLTGRAVWQASAVYRGGKAKTDAKDARIIADQSRMRGEDLPVLHPDDDLIAELRMLTAHRADLVADRTRTINRLRQQLVAVCPALERAAVLTQDRGWVALLARYQRPKAIRQSGVSRLTRVLAAVGDPALIGSADHLAAWAGLAPVSRDSGKRTGRLHTPKRYSRRLRRVMYMSALTTIRCDPTSRAYYQRKRDQGKRPIPATICLARRRTNVLYALIRDNRTWQPDSPPITTAAA
jgi:transposase